MTDTMLNVKMLHDAGKTVFIIDTMDNLRPETIEKELGDSNFHLWKYNTYEDCKRAIKLLQIETPAEIRKHCAIVITNAKYITAERTLQRFQDAPSEHPAEPGESIPVVEVPCTDGFPEPVPLKDTFVFSSETKEMFNSRKMLKDLLNTINEVRDAGIAVVVVEGL